MDTRIAVIDDDPTGTQTVRDIPLVTGWETDELAWAMDAAAPVFAVLTNSRAVDEASAAAINRAIGERLCVTARELGIDMRVISRSDSTLRGHFPAEPEALARGLAVCGFDVDLVLVCPSFPEAGRITVDDIHLVRDGAELVPAGDTEYARDRVFGYRASHLGEWIRERAGSAVGVASVGLDDLREGGPERVAARLLEQRGRARYVVANAARPADLDVLARGVELAERRGLRLIYRTGPSFIGARAGLPPAPALSTRELRPRAGRGLVVVGSHTALTTAQLHEAAARHPLRIVWLDAAPDRIAATTAALRAALSEGDAALVTSRHVADAEDSLRASRTVADALVAVVADVARDTPLDWLVAKGGITSHDLAVRALATRRARVLGQLFPGLVSVWELGAGSLLPGLRYVVFPGNVGSEDSLALALDRLKEAR